MEINKKDDSNEFIENLLKNGANETIDIGSEEMQLPTWYDETLFSRGQQAYKKNIFVMFLGMLCGLISVLAIPSILNILTSTNRSGTPSKAYKRYIKTMFHIMTWYESKLEPNSLLWRSLKTVRKVHFTSSKTCEKFQNGYICQKDMALTQFGFMGLSTLNYDKLGIQPDSDFFEGTTHFWRVIGYLLGIKDDYNICTDSWETTKPRLEGILKSTYRPALENTDNKFLDMTTSLIDGLWSFNPFLTVPLMIHFTKRLAGCPGYKCIKSDFLYINENEEKPAEYKNMSLYNQYLLFRMIYVVQYYYKYTIVRLFLNFQIHLSRFLIYYFPFLAFHRFGFKNSYVRIFNKKS